MFGIVNLADMAGNHADTGFLRKLLRFNLVAHRGNRARRRADKGNAGFVERLGKTLPLREKSIAGMHGFCAGFLAGLDNLVGKQIAFCGGRRAQMHGFVRHLDMRAARVRIRIDRDRRDAHLLGTADNPARNFAAIGDQDFLEHGLIDPRSSGCAAR